jgi:hypothetical protein
MGLPPPPPTPYNRRNNHICATGTKRRAFMSDVLRGNFQTKKKVDVKEPEQNLEDRFESEALKHLGGSIAFVSKKKVKWDTNNGR